MGAIIAVRWSYGGESDGIMWKAVVLWWQTRGSMVETRGSMVASGGLMVASGGLMVASAGGGTKKKRVST